MPSAPGENVMKLANARAQELGVDVRFVHSQRASKVIVSDPDEPPPLDKFEIDVEKAGGWWKACEAAGLIELKPGLSFADFDEPLNCGLTQDQIEAMCADTPQRHMVMREYDDTEVYYLIEQAKVRFVSTGNPTLWHKSRVFNGRQESIGMSKQRQTRLDDIAELAQVEATVCDCGQPLYIAPVERNAQCPACNRRVDNPGFVGEGRTETRREAVGGAGQAAQRICVPDVPRNAKKAGMLHENGDWTCSKCGGANGPGAHHCRHCAGGGTLVEVFEVEGLIE